MYYSPVRHSPPDRSPCYCFPVTIGLKLLSTIEKDLSPESADLLNQRVTARANKDFKRSDEIRDELLAAGVEVRDSTDGQIWKWLKI